MWNHLRTCVLLYAVVCSCMQLYAVVCCCMLLYAVVCCCVLLYAVVCCCVLLCAVVCSIDQVAKNQVSDVMVNMKAPISIIKYFIGIIKNIVSWIHKKMKPKKKTNFF